MVIRRKQCLDLMERIRAEQSAGITYSRFDLDLFIVGTAVMFVLGPYWKILWEDRFC